MKNLLIIFVTFFALSCGSTTSIPNPAIAKELSIEELSRRNLIPIHYPYKKNYTRIMSYLYKNDRYDFLELKGDFRNIRFGNDSAYNLMVGYWEKYGSYTTSLIVLIRTSDNSNESVLKRKITVNSSKFGDLAETPVIKPHSSFKTHPWQLFVRKLEVPSKFDILDMIKDDSITINIDGTEYEFVNPEVK